MRLVALVAIVASAQLAHADERCEVTYVTAPEGMREVIDRWVADEPRCTGTIALRVIPTADGIFLFAERPDGTVHERLVPDLTAAGVLVASWVADAWRIERPRVEKKRRRPALPIRIDAAAQPVDAPPKPVVTASPQKRWLAIGIAGGRGEGADLGFRFEADVIGLGGWRLGVLAQKTEESIGYFDPVFQVDNSGQIDDWVAGVHLARVLRRGAWELRLAAGIVALKTTVHHADFMDAGVTGNDVQPAVELSALVSRDLGESWAVAVGGEVLSFEQELEGNNHYIGRGGRSGWFAMLRRRI